MAGAQRGMQAHHRVALAVAALGVLVGLSILTAPPDPRQSATEAMRTAGQGDVPQHGAAPPGGRDHPDAADDQHTGDPRWGGEWLSGPQAEHASMWRAAMWGDDVPSRPATVDTVKWSSRKSWMERLLRRRHPALITGGPVQKWKALQKWRDDPKRHICGAVPVLNDAVRMAPAGSAVPDTFLYLNPNAPLARSNAGGYVGADWYATGNMSCEAMFEPRKGDPLAYFSSSLGAVAEELLADVMPMRGIEDPDEPRINLWIGQKGATARMHFDASHNMFVQLHGQKRMLFVGPEQWDDLRMYSRLHPAHRQSQLDPTRDAAPALVVRTVVLSPGDMLYIPPMHFHHVTALDTSVSVNVYRRTEFQHVLQRIFTSWPMLPTYRGGSSGDIEPCVMHDLVEFAATVVRISVVRLPSRIGGVKEAVLAFFKTIVETRFSKLHGDPLFKKGEVFVGRVEEQGMEVACARLTVADVEGYCSTRGDVIAVLEVARTVAKWMLRLPAPMRGMLVADYLEQAVFRVLGLRHVHAFFTQCAPLATFVDVP